MESGALVRDTEALDEGQAFAVLEGYARVPITGSDALPWLLDLLTADLASLAPGGARRSFFLTPTGRIRADVHVIRRPDGFALLERDDETTSVATLLAPYVLSSDVRIGEPLPCRIALVPSAGAVGILPQDPAAFSPSILGEGLGVVLDPGEVDAFRASVAPTLREVTPEAADALRIHRGIPRWRVDIEPDGFPVGALVEDAVAHAKGCFLGQEAIAKIRNLGHPPTVLRHLATAAHPSAADPVLAEGTAVGSVTSVAASAAGSVLLARTDWRAAASELTSSDGVPLHDQSGHARSPS
jgi:tRNA-modifying protein YgfZ